MPSKSRTWTPNAPCRVDADDQGDRIVSKLWFKTEPLDNTFIYRVAQLQLSTDSQARRFVDNKAAGIWSWFELAILPNEESTEPIVRDGKELVWRSHGNRLEESNTRHFGIIFDRRAELLDALEVGNSSTLGCVRCLMSTISSPAMSSVFAFAPACQAGSTSLIVEL